MKLHQCYTTNYDGTSFHKMGENKLVVKNIDIKGIKYF